MSNATPITTTAAAIAAQVGETAPGARATIWRTVRTFGLERAQAFVTQALEAEANGGMLLPDGNRTRTLGGIFFYLVRTQITDAEVTVPDYLRTIDQHQPRDVLQIWLSFGCWLNG